MLAVMRELFSNGEDALAWLLAVAASFMYMALGFAAIAWTLKGF